MRAERNARRGKIDVCFIRLISAGRRKRGGSDLHNEAPYQILWSSDVYSQSSVEWQQAAGAQDCCCKGFFKTRKLMKHYLPPL